VGIIDFDDCSHLWYAADIAFALGDLFEENVDLGNKRFRAFVGGYSERRDVDPNLRFYVPMFLRFGDLLRYARIVRAVDLPVRTEHPDWLVALSRKLHDRMAVYRASVESRWA
jgi:Ser/Thr protein kinase RdoA (MazF antagonist)